MANIIKTAIITIIISFISGLMLEYYKNLAPRLLCNIKNAMPIKINNKKICAYIITVSNVSNKTIHELTLYIQSPHTNLRITDAKITKGLKFDSSIEDNTIDVYIPFLSKNDKFSVTVYAENQYEMFNKPVIIIRSPENFKQIDSLKQNGILSLLLNIPKNLFQAISKTHKKPESVIPNRKDDFTMVMNKVSDDKETINKYNKKRFNRNKKPSNAKKAIIAIVSIIFIISVGVLGKSYFKGASTKASTSGVKTIVPNKSNDGTNSSGSAKNTGTKASTKKTDRNESSKTPTVKTTENTGSKTSTDDTKVNTDSKASTDGTNANTDSKTSTDGTKVNTDSKTSTDGTKVNTDSKTPTDETKVNTSPTTPTDGTKVNTGN